MKLTLQRGPWLAPAGVALALAGSTSVAAENEAQQQGPWEISVGAGAVSLPEYPGSDEYETRGLPVVSLRYKRFFLGAAPGSGSPAGLGAYLYDGETFRLGTVVSMDSTKPREESDDESLRGLGDIDAAVRVGLFSSYQVASWLTLRAAALTDVSDKEQGTTANVDVEFTYRPTPRLTLSGGPGLTWADQDHMQTFFGVTEEQAASSGLTVYMPESSVSVVRLSFAAQYRFWNQWFAAARITAAQLQDDATASAIVKDKNQNLYALYFGYRF